MRVVELFTFYYEGGTWYPARTGPLCSYELFISAIPRLCARPHFNLADECARELHKHRIAVSILNLSRCPVLTMRARVKRIFSIDPRQPRPQLGPRRVRLILHVFIRLNRLLGGECVLAYTRFSYSIPGCSSSFVSRHSFVPHPITHRSFEPITIVLALVALANRERFAAGARKRMTSNARNALEKRQRRGEIFPKTTRETRLVNVKEWMYWHGIWLANKTPIEWRQTIRAVFFAFSFFLSRDKKNADSWSGSERKEYA